MSKKQLENREKESEKFIEILNKISIVSKTDLDGIITHVNDNFAEMSGYSKEELINSSHNIIRHPDTPKKTFIDLWETLKRDETWEGELKNRRKDGSHYWVKSIITPLFENNQKVGYLGIRQNISDKKSLEEKVASRTKSLYEALEHIKSAEKVKSSFLAKMSHEMKTPLNSILGFSQLLSNSNELSEKNIQYANNVESSAKSLLSNVNKILDVAKVESGEFNINLKEINIYDTCNNVYTIFSKRADYKKLNFNYHIDENIPLFLLADNIKIRQVLSNLIENAIKFTQEFGTIDFNVKLKEQKKSNVIIQFSVSDTGIGIKKEHMDSIFEPFMQVENDSNRSYEGSGIGLSICSNIIESFGSKINVKSTIEEGSTFYFDLELKICDKKSKKEKNKVEEENIITTKISVESVAAYLNLPEAIASRLFTKFKDDIYNDLNELKSFIKNENHSLIEQKATYIKNSCLNVDLKDAISLLEDLKTNCSDKKSISLNKFLKLNNIIKNSLQES